MGTAWIHVLPKFPCEARKSKFIITDKVHLSAGREEHRFIQKSIADIAIDLYIQS